MKLESPPLESSESVELVSLDSVEHTGTGQALATYQVNNKSILENFQEHSSKIYDSLPGTRVERGRQGPQVAAW